MADKSSATETGGPENDEKAKVTFKRPKFSKPKGGQMRNRRKRERESDDEEDGSSTLLGTKTNKFSQKAPNVHSTSSGKKSANSSQAVTQIESKREATPYKYAGDATYQTEIDTAQDRDARAILERNIKLNKEGATDDGKSYRGMAGYRNYITKDEAQIGANKYTGTQGPIRAPTWARQICVFDYQPDICKDYKETGFCGFGDSCKFVHDRGDYKSGWQLEKEYEEEQKRKEMRLRGEAGDDDDDENYAIDSDEDVQFACTICREAFTDPVETMCGHYFCQKCALERYRESVHCFVCNKNTNGVFNAATKLQEKLSKIVRRKEKSSEEGDGTSTEADGEIVAPTVTAPVKRKSKGQWTSIS